MKTIDTQNFDGLEIKIASPETIRSWSFGEVTKPETINYRTGRSERYGLFDERIFGPEKDYECYCGKYRRIRYKDIICEKCGVEVTKSIVRRERMGHIELASPVAHIWFLRNVPSRISLILAQPVSDVEKVIYFAGYVVKSVNLAAKAEILANLDSEFKAKVKSANDEKTQDKLRELLTSTKKEIEEIKPSKIFDELTYHRYAMKYGTMFEAGIGAEAIFDLFKLMDLKAIEEGIVKQLEKAGALERDKAEKRLSLIRAFQIAGIRPEWMFLTTIPVIPPGIRPMVALEGGRYAASDVNDLYRRVINRNNRLKKLMEIGAPDVILRNEKRILQEAVDALIDNSARHGQDAVMSQSQKRQLKSLSDNLKGKQGLLRGNLLGKRVDYSARSVIVVGPSLALNECGLPKHMALELFKPFIISKILERELAFNIRGANKLIEDGIPEVWAILEECIKGKYVLLNRAPTLHRLGIQAFNPKLIEGNAISLHPLVCSAFNADFDGDQMAVHLPLSIEAQEEARTLMAANRNLLKPGSGDSTVNPRMDMVLGTYWMTKDIDGEKGENKYFASPNEAITAYEFGILSFRAKIWVLASTDKEKYAKYEGKPFQTTVGKLLFNSVFPTSFPYINEEVTGKKMNGIIDQVILTYGLDTAPSVIDKIKAFGYKYATISGTTWNIDAVKVPPEKGVLVEEGWRQAARIVEDFQEGLLSEEERYEKTILSWQDVRKKIEKLIPASLEKHGSVYDLITSEARGSMAQVIQMSGMKGIIVNNSGRNIDFPVISSYKEGLTPLEYFITTYGARKGNSDTALKTAQAGYLTRRLVDVAQDAIITEVDCGTKEHKIVRKENALGIEVPISKNVRGRVIAEDIIVGGKVIFKKNHLVSKDDALEIENSGVEEVKVFSPLVCQSMHGLCQKCYGLDMGRNHQVQLGEAVGIVAAQAIGEPGTQLTMRTFHSGGVAGTDITQGLPRVEEIFERRTPKNPSIIAHESGEVLGIRDEGKEKVIIILADDDGAKGNKSGKQIEYTVPFRRQPIVKVGDMVKKGAMITDGSADIDELFNQASKEAAEEYIVSEINKVYELQGASISRKHVEIVIKQMFGRIKVSNPGDTKFTQSDIVEISNFRTENNRVKKNGGVEAKGKHLVLGITDVALSTSSWLSSASFQNTTRVLINASTRGQIDELRGLKENVIIGRLIPAGTGLREKKDKKS
ncbi:MAG: DNA-directed polymerase subunit beta, DNA-directed polymerase subunit beta [Candidatus Nomurabacteria bacterium]|nr:DNA-directed polymerase subunit beta, DNA-directed polymerase subunit beta [Candidatus Nomurabacteria bacterium]